MSFMVKPIFRSPINQRIVPEPPEEIRLVHGEDGARHALAEALYPLKTTINQA